MDLTEFGTWFSFRVFPPFSESLNVSLFSRIWFSVDMPPKGKKRKTSGVAASAGAGSTSASPKFDVSVEARAEAMRHNTALLDLDPIHIPEDWGEHVHTKFLNLLYQTLIS